MAGQEAAELGLGGHSVTRCIVSLTSFGLELLGDGAEPTVLRVQSTFRQQQGDGTPVLLNQSAGDVLPAIALLGAVVAAATADEAGGLRIDFDGGRRLVVDPDPQYEAWELDGPRRLLISVAGGGLAVFDRPPRAEAGDGGPNGGGGR